MEVVVADLKSAYRTINEDEFPSKMELSFIEEDGFRQTLFYEKVQWDIDGHKAGLRYGENPDQKAAFYRLINGNLTIGKVKMLAPGRWLTSEAELLQSGKHPGKINITDVDAGLNILRYLSEDPAAVIIKHNNPCGAAIGGDIAEAYRKAYLADRIAAFGGAVVLNRPVDKSTAEQIDASYSEVVAAPEFEEGSFEILSRKKNLRIMKIASIARLQEYRAEQVVDFKSLIDGGIVAQWSFLPAARSPADFLPAVVEHKGTEYRVERQPSKQELADMYFGWMVEAGVTSNSVIYVKEGATVGVGTGEQDRVGVAEIARDKAYRKYADRLAWLDHGTPFNLLTDPKIREDILARTKRDCGGLRGSTMISDAFFPFRDGAEVGLREGVSAILQPGGSLRDFETIEACNEYGATMMFTGQRSFRH